MQGDSASRHHTVPGRQLIPSKWAQMVSPIQLIGPQSVLQDTTTIITSHSSQDILPGQRSVPSNIHSKLQTISKIILPTIVHIIMQDSIPETPIPSRVATHENCRAVFQDTGLAHVNGRCVPSKLKPIVSMLKPNICFLSPSQG